METRGSLETELLETPAAKEAVVFANTASYVLNRIRVDTSADYVAKSLTTPQIIEAIRDILTQSSGTVNELVKFYVLLTSLALRPDVSDFKELLISLSFGSIPWAREIITLILQEQVPTVVKNIVYESYGRVSNSARAISTNTTVGTVVTGG